MKYLKFFILSLGLLLCSCNHNDEVPTETLMSIAQQYLPATVEFQQSNKDFLEKAMEFNDKKFIINSLSELSTDPFGFSDAYRGIDFDNYTLLVTYKLHDWVIDTYRNRYYRNNPDKTYNWAIHVGTSTVPGETIDDTLYFTRFAILVDKVPQDTDVLMWLSLGALNWGWE